ncbi:GumC family protein [Vibrio sp. WJH972]
MQHTFQASKSGSGDIFDIWNNINILRQNWLKIVLFSVMVTVLTVLVMLQITPKYTATATLLIEAQEAQAVSIQSIPGIDSTQKEYYQTQFEILKSNQIASRVIDTLNLEDLPEFNPALSEEEGLMSSIKSLPLLSSLFAKEVGEISQEAIDEAIHQKVLSAFHQRMVIDPLKNTQLVNISFTSEDPVLAAEIANAIGIAYIEQNLDARLELTTYTTNWINSRLSGLQETLMASEKALSDYLIQEKLIDDSGIDSLASKELESLTERLLEVRDRRIEVSSAYSALKSTSASDIAAISSIPAISNHPQVVAIRAAELEAQNEVNELKKRYGAKHDRMIAAIARLDAVEARAEKTVGQLITGFEKEVQALRRQESLIQSTINQRRDEFQGLSVKKTRYESLKRDVETNRDVLNVFLTRQKETSATQDFKASNARFTDKAMVPQLPAYPKKKLIVLLAFVASFGLAIVLVLLSAMMKNTIESAKNFEDRFGLIPLGGIPNIQSKRFKKKPLDNSVLFDNSELSFSESIRSIRTSLVLNSNGNKRLAVTSSLPSEGKTTVSINIAMAFAKLEKTVLIDCDLRKSSVAERFGLKKYQQGLSNHLMMGMDLTDCLYKDQQSGLTILPAGMLATSPQELLSSDKFAELMDTLETQFDRIVIDTPPSLPVSDSLIIGQLTKNALVVVKANETKQDAVKKTFGKLLQHEINIAGVVINQISPQQASLEYGYGQYGSYGATQ